MATMGNRRLSLTPKFQFTSVESQPKTDTQGVVMLSGDVILCAPVSAISITPIMPEGFITDSQLMPPRFE